VAGLALAFFPDDSLRGWGLWVLLIYGAIILSFMGGVHWGAAMLRDEISFGALGRSVLPSLLALPAVALGGTLGLCSSRSAFAGFLSMTRARFALSACRPGIQNCGVH
jgi:hypothetical protein